MATSGKSERIEIGRSKPRPLPRVATGGKRIVVTRRGKRAIRVIRDAVSDIETTWTQQLGSERFAQLRELLLELNQLT